MIKLYFIYSFFQRYFFYMAFDAVWSNTDKVHSINLCANIFVFRDFIVCHKEWLTYSGGTDKSGQLYYNFSIAEAPYPDG